jgi:hypothetical protein
LVCCPAIASGQQLKRCLFNALAAALSLAAGPLAALMTRMKNWMLHFIQVSSQPTACPLPGSVLVLSPGAAQFPCAACRMCWAHVHVPHPHLYHPTAALACQNTPNSNQQSRRPKRPHHAKPRPSLPLASQPTSLQAHGFWGILLLAAYPNAAFDLCGICCGAFQMPFWEFFGATLIGKGGIKVC